MFRTLRSLIAAASLASILVTACSTDETNKPAEVTLDSIAVSPATLTLTVGLSQKLTVTGTYSDGTTSTLLTDLVWGSSAPAVAAVNDGDVKAVAVGSAAITVTWAGKSATASVTAVAPVLTAIAITPAAVAIVVGENQQLALNGTYSDNTTKPVVDGIFWKSSNPLAAFVVATGVVTGSGVGTSTITAEVGRLRTTAPVTVADAPLTSILIVHDPFSLDVGATEQITATGFFGGIDQRDVTSTVAWSSSAEAVATVSPAGLVTGVSVGTAKIFATLQDMTAAVDVAVTKSTSPVVFVNGYAPGVRFEGFSASTNDVSIDHAEMHEGHASLKVTVPAAGWTGGTFKTASARDLSAYNAVTFWMKGSVLSTLEHAGLGHTNGASSPLRAEIDFIPVMTDWTKYAVPVPMGSKVTDLGALFHFATSGTDSTVWIADLQYEALSGTDLVAGNPAGAVGTQTVTRTIGATVSFEGAVAFFSSALGRYTTVKMGNRYLDFTSTDPSVASVDLDGVVTAHKAGTATVSAKLGAADLPGAIELTVTTP